MRKPFHSYAGSIAPLAELQTLRCPAAHKSTLQRVIGCSRCCALHTYLFSSLRLESCHGLYCRRVNRSDPHRYAGPCSCCFGPLQSCSLDIDMARNSNRELASSRPLGTLFSMPSSLSLFLFLLRGAIYVHRIDPRRVMSSRKRKLFSNHDQYFSGREGKESQYGALL